MSKPSSSYPSSEKGEPVQSSNPSTIHVANVVQDYATNQFIPLDRAQTVLLPAFGGAFQPAPYKPSFRKFANPAPLGLCAFALTTFVLSMANARASDVKVPAIAVGAAYAYGGLIQLLAGMWEMAIGSQFIPINLCFFDFVTNLSSRYLWCHRSFVVRWFLDFLGSH